MKIEKESIELGDRTLTIEFGEMAKQSNGSCVVRMGDTTVLCAVVAAKEPNEKKDMLPLTVNYRERTYAAGKIPGGFFKREGRPRENEILVSRLIDRTIRPLFPPEWFNDTQITALVLSYDGENDSDVISIIGTSAALMLSDIPFNNPVGSVRIGKVDNKFVVNPTISQQEISSLDLVVSGTEENPCMVEAGASELSENEIEEALILAQKEIKKICALQKSFKGKGKIKPPEIKIDQNLKNEIEKSANSKIEEFVRIADKEIREKTWEDFKKSVVENLLKDYPEQESTIKNLLEEIFYIKARELILNKNVRTDGRKLNEIRTINCKTSILPRTHGSSLFTRGQTQALVTVTLGAPSDMQRMDELGGDYKERFMLHYNFPGFATGEAKPERGLSRREMGHGALARRSLLPLLPPEEEFPYAIRIVSDILESNGSSSMASVCGGSLALFDAGVPISSGCAGIAMGLIKEGNKYAILTDILGMEDHLGDMDFKVAGTRKGITALQMDIKITGITTEIMAEALEQARIGRMSILDKMEAEIPKPRAELSSYAPRIISITINPSKIGALIGPGGKNIRKIQEDTGVKIDVTDEGRVSISCDDALALAKAKEMVEYLTAEIEVGQTYKGKVTRLMNFGAFVEILPGKEGLVHISQLSNENVKKVEDVVSEGDEITVKVIEIDKQGRINLSKKAVL
ncbi:MAG: polyribonucleotide nucleotidyltransferase [Elusimicrobia bacterium]|nr:polyribonucleotide nucleotidyltransferase [Elusimicrobiota bacterium]